MGDETAPTNDAKPLVGNMGSEPNGAADAVGYTDADRERILERLSEGESLRKICAADDMPSRETIRQWQLADSNFDLAVTHAREEGYHALAELALEEAAKSDDATKDRLKFDARRWYLGKLSNAFSDNKPQAHNVSGKVIHGVEIEFVNKAEG